MARPGADRRRPGPALRRVRRCSKISASRTCCWSASPKGRTAMPGASISTCRAASRSASIPKARCSTTCNACATRRIASPSAATARSAPRRSAPIPLDEIAGIGAARKRALLQHFGSAKRRGGGQPRRSRGGRGRQQAPWRRRFTTSSIRQVNGVAHTEGATRHCARSRMFHLPNTITILRILAGAGLRRGLRAAGRRLAARRVRACSASRASATALDGFAARKLNARSRFRPHARSDRRQDPGRRGADDAGRRRHVRRVQPFDWIPVCQPAAAGPGADHPVARDSGVGPARIPGRRVGQRA